MILGFAYGLAHVELSNCTMGLCYWDKTYPMCYKLPIYAPQPHLKTENITDKIKYIAVNRKCKYVVFEFFDNSSGWTWPVTF